MLSSCWLTSPFSGCFNTAIKGVVGGVHDTSEAGPARTRMNQGQTVQEKTLLNGSAGGFHQSSITLGGGRGAQGGVTTIAPKSSNQEPKPPSSSQVQRQEKGPQDSTQQQQQQQQQEQQQQPQTPPMESEMDGDDKFLKRTYKSEYRKKFRPFSQYQYVDGKFHKAKAEGETPNTWYKEVLELRKQAGQYRCRGWGVETASDRMAEIYNKQVELWEQVSRRSSLQALSLASAAPSRPISKAEKEIENSRRSSPIKHARDRPSTAPSKQKPAPVHKPADKVDGKTQKDSTTPRHHYDKTTGSADGFIITSPTRDRIEPIACSDWSTRRSPRKTPPITSPVKDGIPNKRRPPRAISVARTSTTKDNKVPPAPNKSSTSIGKTLNSSKTPLDKKKFNLAGRSVSVGPENRSPKRTSRPQTGTHPQAPSAKTERRPRPTSLTTSSRRKGADSAIPHHEAKKSTKKPHDISASPKRATDLKGRDERRQSSEEDKKDKEKDGKEIIKDALKDTVGRKSTPEPRFDPEKYEPVVKTPPEPTRVKSPDQVMVKSPDPVNWTVPLDTGKTFTVTSNVPEGEASRGTPSSEHRPPLESRSRQTPEPTKVYQGSLAGTPITTAGTVSSAPSAPTSTTSTAASSHLPSKTDSVSSVKTSTPSTTASSISASVPVEKVKEPVSGSSVTSISSSSDTVPIEIEDKITKPSEISTSTASKPLDSKLSSIKETSPQPTDSSKPYQELPNTSEVVEAKTSPSASIPSSVGLLSGTFEVVGSDSTNNFNFSDSNFQGAPINASLITTENMEDFGDSNLSSGKFINEYVNTHDDGKDFIPQETLDTQYSKCENEYELAPQDTNFEHIADAISKKVDTSLDVNSSSSFEDNFSDQERQSFGNKSIENNDGNICDIEREHDRLEEKVSSNDLTKTLNDTDSEDDANENSVNFIPSVNSFENNEEIPANDHHLTIEKSHQETYDIDKVDIVDESENLNNDRFEENDSYKHNQTQGLDNAAFSGSVTSENEGNNSIPDAEISECYNNDTEKSDEENNRESIDTQEKISNSNYSFNEKMTDLSSELNFTDHDETFNIKSNDVLSHKENSVAVGKLELSFSEDISTQEKAHDDDYEVNFEQHKNNINDVEVSECCNNDTENVDEKSNDETVDTKEKIKDNTYSSAEIISDVSSELALTDQDDTSSIKSDDILSHEVDSIAVNKLEFSYSEDISTQDKPHDDVEKVSFQQHDNNINDNSTMFPDKFTEMPDNVESFQVLEKDKKDLFISDNSIILAEDSNLVENNDHITTFNKEESDMFDNEKVTHINTDDNERISFHSDILNQDEGVKRTSSKTSVNSKDSNENVTSDISLSGEVSSEKMFLENSDVTLQTVDNKSLEISSPTQEINETKTLELSMYAEESTDLHPDKVNLKFESTSIDNEISVNESEKLIETSLDAGYVEDKYETLKQISSSTSSSSSSSSSDTDNEESNISLNYERRDTIDVSQSVDNPILALSENEDKLFSSDNKMSPNAVGEYFGDNNSESKELFSPEDRTSVYNDNSVEINESVSKYSNNEEIPSYKYDNIHQENPSVTRDNDREAFLPQNQFEVKPYMPVGEIETSHFQENYSSNNYSDNKMYNSDYPVESENSEFSGNLSESSVSSTMKYTSDANMVPEINKESLKEVSTSEEHPLSTENNTNPFEVAYTFKNDSLSRESNQMSTEKTLLSVDTLLSNDQKEIINPSEASDNELNRNSNDFLDSEISSRNHDNELDEERKGIFSTNENSVNRVYENATTSDDENDSNFVPKLSLQKKRVSFSVDPNSGEESEGEAGSISVQSHNDENKSVLLTEPENPINEGESTDTFNTGEIGDELVLSSVHPHSSIFEEMKVENFESTNDKLLAFENSDVNINESGASQNLSAFLIHSDVSDLDSDVNDENKIESKYTQHHFKNPNFSGLDPDVKDESENIEHHFEDMTHENTYFETPENRFSPIHQQNEAISDEDDEYKGVYLKRNESFEYQESEAFEHSQSSKSNEPNEDPKESFKSQSDDSDNDKHSVSSEKNQDLRELSLNEHLEIESSSSSVKDLDVNNQLHHDNIGYENSDDNHSVSIEISQNPEELNSIEHLQMESSSPSVKDLGVNVSSEYVNTDYENDDGKHLMSSEDSQNPEESNSNEHFQMESSSPSVKELNVNVPLESSNLDCENDDGKHSVSIEKSQNPEELNSIEHLQVEISSPSVKDLDVNVSSEYVNTDYENDDGKHSMSREDSQNLEESKSNEHLQMEISSSSVIDLNVNVPLEYVSVDHENDDYKHSMSSEECQNSKELTSNLHLGMEGSSSVKDLNVSVPLDYDNIDCENDDSYSFSSENSQIISSTERGYNETNFPFTNRETFENTTEKEFVLYDAQPESSPDVSSKDVVKRLFASSRENISDSYTQDDTLADITRLETDTFQQNYSQVNVDDSDKNDISNITSYEKLNVGNFDSDMFSNPFTSNINNNIKMEDNRTSEQAVSSKNYNEMNSFSDDSSGVDPETNFHFDVSTESKRRFSEGSTFRENISDEERTPSDDSASESVKEQIILESSEFRSDDPNLFINAELKYDQRASETLDHHRDSMGYTSMTDNSSEYKNLNMNSNLNPFSNGNYSSDKALIENTNTDLTPDGAELNSSPNFEYLKSYVPNYNPNENSNYFDNINNGHHLHDQDYESYESSESMVIQKDESSSSKNVNEIDFNKISTKETL